MSSSPEGLQQRNLIRRVTKKHIIIPTEHGSWAWLLVPFAVGLGVSKQFNLAVFLVLVGGLAVFFMRQPATVWLRVRKGKARASDGPIAASWVITLLSIGVLCFVGLLALGQEAILWLVWPFLLVFSLYLLAARYSRVGKRSLWMELAGAAALSMMAPAATIAGDGRLESWEWALWGLMAAQNMLGALYVRLRVADTHNRQINRWPTFIVHSVGFLLVVWLGAVGYIPVGASIPFIFYLLRSAWAVAAPRPVPNIKRFGFTELGVEIVSGLWIIISYWLN